MKRKEKTDSITKSEKITKINDKITQKQKTKGEKEKIEKPKAILKDVNF